MAGKHCVYMLRSVGHPDRTYVGLTADIERRIAEHNSGTQTYTKRYAPWRLVTYVVFEDSQKAVDFERYLKTRSGRAFMRKRFL